MSNRPQGKISVVRRKMARAFASMVKRHCDGTGDRHLDIAEELGCSPGHFSNILHNDAAMTVEVLVRASAVLNDTEALEEVCHLAGGSFIAFPAVRYADTAAVIEAASRSAKESGEAIQVALQAIADGVISDEERDRCTKEIGEAICAFDALRKNLESCSMVSDGRVTSLAETARGRRAS
jgi:hypothetical protein